MTNLTGRLLLQKCDKAMLKNSTVSTFGDDLITTISINNGLMVYVSFLKGATIKTVESMCKAVCSVCLFNEENKIEKVDLPSFPGDLLLIPHFCLGGKLKGKTFQYHGIADKLQAEILFLELCNLCKDTLIKSEKWKLGNCKVEHGVYGLRQDIIAEMNGPLSHIIDFNE